MVVSNLTFFIKITNLYNNGTDPRYPMLVLNRVRACAHMDRCALTGGRHSEVRWSVWDHVRTLMLSLFLLFFLFSKWKGENFL